MELSKISAAKLEALYKKRGQAVSKNCDAMIAAGRGHEKSWDILAKGKAGTDVLSVEYFNLSKAVGEVISEMEARRTYHGNLKPIKTA